jgi:hypothetical protein
MDKDLFIRLQNWYKINCNGIWEHSHGLRIANIDNPGWEVTIDLEETPVENAVFEKSFDLGEEDWLDIKVKDKKFKGYGDPNKLGVILKIFLDEFIPNYADKDFSYDLYEMIMQNGKQFYKKLKGRIITEDSFEIMEVPDFEYQELKMNNFDDLEGLNFDQLINKGKIKPGEVVKCDLKKLADHPAMVVIR